MDQEAKWYVLHTLSGYENVAKTNLEMVIKKYNMEDRIFEIIIPMEETIEDKNGKKKLVQHKLLPSYIVVKMIYGDDLWHNITRTRGITGFVGPKGRPICITDEEARKMGVDGGEATVAKMDVVVNVGDMVEIIEGSLSSFVGTVKAVDNENQKVTCVVEMFGRESEVELGFNQIRISNN